MSCEVLLCAPPSCSRASTNRRCSSGDQHRLCLFFSGSFGLLGGFIWSVTDDEPEPLLPLLPSKFKPMSASILRPDCLLNGKNAPPLFLKLQSWNGFSVAEPSCTSLCQQIYQTSLIFSRLNKLYYFRLY